MNSPTNVAFVFPIICGESYLVLILESELFSLVFKSEEFELFLLVQAKIKMHSNVKLNDFVIQWLPLTDSGLAPAKKRISSMLKCSDVQREFTIK